MLGDVMIWICHQLLTTEAVPIKTKKKSYQWESGLLMNVQKAFSTLQLKIKFLILVHLMNLDAKNKSLIYVSIKVEQWKKHINDSTDQSSL